MTQKIPVLSIAIAATAAITAERFITATGAVATAAGNAIGVATTGAAIGDQVNTDVLGTSVVMAGAAIAKGAAIEVGTAGKAVTKASGVTVARALQAATADGDRIEVALIPN
jgi:hypothetical protein